MEMRRGRNEDHPGIRSGEGWRGRIGEERGGISQNRGKHRLVERLIPVYRLREPRLGALERGECIELLRGRVGRFARRFERVDIAFIGIEECDRGGRGGTWMVLLDPGVKTPSDQGDAEQDQQPSGRSPDSSCCLKR